MITLRLWWRLSRRAQDGRLTTILALVGFGVVTAVLLTTVAGALALSARPDPTGTYALLAQTASVIVVVPVITLGGSAARLAVSRRNARLAALRLAGATSRQVATIAVVDAAVQALAGAVLGTGLYLLALPAVAMIRFQGRPFRWSELLITPGLLGLTIVAVLLLATGSAAFALAAVVISPLGVARRTTPRRLTVFRLLIFVAAFALWTPLLNGGALQLGVLIIVVGVCFATLDLVGPYVLRLIGRLSLPRARTVAALLAARRLLDDPKGAWRTVGGVTMATFVAGLMSVGPFLSDGLGDEAGRELGRDVLTGSIVTLVIAALVAAASAGVNQAARVLDSAEHYRTLHLAGTPTSVLKAARLREVALPLVSSVVIAAATACVLVAPVGLSMITSRPAGVIIFALGALGAVLLVIAAVAVSQPLVERVASGDQTSHPTAADLLPESVAP